MTEPPTESSEDRLIAKYFMPLATSSGAFGLLDDAAVLTPPPGCDLVLKTDAIIGGVLEDAYLGLLTAIQQRVYVVQEFLMVCLKFAVGVIDLTAELLQLVLGGVSIDGLFQLI